MKYKLINEINKNYSTIETVLTNRGIKLEDIKHYLNTTDDDINDCAALGLENLKAAAAILIKTISENKNTLIVVDCDCDGYTSSAVLINYLHDLFPNWVENHLKWFLHEGKTHGLSDVMEYIYNHDIDLVICPDSSSNDYSEHENLHLAQIPVIVLDHHEAEKISENAIVINNQLCDYPNKEFSGVGIVWQFCRYLDKILQKNNANNYLDLVALGLTGDMMSLKSIETKHLINKGFKDENIVNPFIYGMFIKNSFSLGTHITPMGAAFYIVPFVNAMVRSGTLEEMELLFNSMLKHKAFKEIPSNKRGHKPGEMERVVDQALRTATNVKNRQTREQDKAVEKIKQLIEDNNMMEHKVLLFLLEPGEVDGNIAGLIANKIMAKYQRPVCMLTKVETNETIQNGYIEENDNNGNDILTPNYEKAIYWRGSARGYDKSGVNNFKDICYNTGLVEYAEGHQNAFGISIPDKNIDKFIELTDLELKDMQSEPLYYVDYIYKGVDVNPENILTIAGLDNLWGQGMDESWIAIEDLKVSSEMITLMSPDKRPTLKITLPNKISLIKFKSSQEEYESLLNEGYIQMNIVGKCNSNEWMGNITPQLLIEDYEIVGQNKYNF